MVVLWRSSFNYQVISCSASFTNLEVNDDTSGAWSLTCFLMAI